MHVNSGKQLTVSVHILQKVTSWGFALDLGVLRWTLMVSAKGTRLLNQIIWAASHTTRSSRERDGVTDTSHVREPLGRDDLLQMNRSAAQEPERRVHGPGAVHRPLVQAAHAVSVVEEDSPGVVVQADADPLRHGQDSAVIPGGAGGRFGDEEPAHAHGDQREGLRDLQTGVFTAAVVTAVVVVPDEKKRRTSADEKLSWTMTTEFNDKLPLIVNRVFTVVLLTQYLSI